MLLGPVGADVRALALVLLLTACKTSHTLDAREDVKLSDVEHAQASGEKHEGPWTETIYDFAPAPEEPDQPPAGTSGVAPAAAHTGLPIRITVREHSGDTEAWRSSSDGVVGAETSLNLKAEDKSEPDGSCAFSGGLWLALVGVGLAGLIYFRRAALLAVCKRLVGIP